MKAQHAPSGRQNAIYKAMSEVTQPRGRAEMGIF